jgi:programmed cell death protein 5
MQSTSGSSIQLPPGMRPSQPPGGGPGGAGSGGNGGGAPSQEEQAAIQAQEDEMRRNLMSQVLEPEARERRESSGAISPVCWCCSRKRDG